MLIKIIQELKGREASKGVWLQTSDMVVIKKPKTRTISQLSSAKNLACDNNAFFNIKQRETLKKN